MTKIQINNSDSEDYTLSCERAIADLRYVQHSDMYINEKGYYQKLIDLLFSFGYYITNKSIFTKTE